MLSRGHYFLFHGSNKDLERDPRGKSYRTTTSFSTNVFGTIYMPSSSTFPLAVQCPEYPCISVNSLLAVNRTSVNQIPYFVHWPPSLCTDQTNLCTLVFTSNIYLYIHLSICIYIYIYLSIYLSVCLSVCLSIYLSIYIYMLYTQHDQSPSSHCNCSQLRHAGHLNQGSPPPVVAWSMGWPRRPRMRRRRSGPMQCLPPQRL